MVATLRQPQSRTTLTSIARPRLVVLLNEDAPMTDTINRGPSRAHPRASPAMPLDPDQFQQLVLNGLEEVKAGLSKLSDQGSAHNTQIAGVEKDIIAINVVLNGANNRPGLVDNVSDLTSFKRIVMAFLVVGGGLGTIFAAISPILVANWLDGQAKLREAAHQADLAAYVQKMGRGGSSSTTTTFEQTSPIPPAPAAAKP